MIDWKIIIHALAGVGAAVVGLLATWAYRRSRAYWLARARNDGLPNSQGKVTVVGNHRFVPADGSAWSWGYSNSTQQAAEAVQQMDQAMESANAALDNAMDQLEEISAQVILEGATVEHPTFEPSAPAQAYVHSKAPRELYDAKEAMERLGINENELQTYVARGDIRAFRSAGKMMFRHDDLETLAREFNLKAIPPPTPPMPAAQAGDGSRWDEL